MFALATVITRQDDILYAIALAKSIKIFSMGKSIVVTSDQISSQEEIKNVFDVVIPVANPTQESIIEVFNLEEYKKILLLPVRSLLIAPIDMILAAKTPFAVYRENVITDVIGITPSKFAYDLLLAEMSSLRGSFGQRMEQFYQNHRYTMGRIPGEVYRTDKTVTDETKIVSISTPGEGWRSFLDDTYLYTLSDTKRANLSRHLLVILEPILGERTREVVKKHISLYEQAFTSKSVNPISNYELLEAYGDRFLAGQYSWLLLGTPGVINADQITKIASFFQDRYQLETVCNFLELAPYINTKESKDTKTRSDVVESLIAAIGISWQRETGRGDLAMRKFIFSVWNTLFTIDPENYELLYSEPKTRVKELAESLNLDRTLLRALPPVVKEKEVMTTIVYGNIPIGVGKVSSVGIYEDTAKRLSKKEAYLDVLRRKTLESIK